MRCEQVERAILERGLGLLGERDVARLERHLGVCHACLSLARAESRIDEAFSGLAGAYPFPIDVTARVMAGIGDRPPGRELSDRQIAWGSAWAAIAATALLAAAVVFDPFAAESTRYLRALAQGGVTVVATLLRSVLELSGALARVLGRLLAQIVPPDLLPNLLPALAVASGLACCVLLLGSAAVVLGRDLSRLRPADRRGGS